MCGFTKPVLNMGDCIQFKKICPRNDYTLKHQEKSLIKFCKYDFLKKMTDDHGDSKSIE